MIELFQDVSRLGTTGLLVLRFFPYLLIPILLYIVFAAVLILRNQEKQLKEMEAKSQGPGLIISTPASVDNAKTNVNTTPDPRPKITQKVDVNVQTKCPSLNYRQSGQL